MGLSDVFRTGGIDFVMKKILFVHYSLVCGGVETALLNLCSMLDKEKYDITILEYEPWNNKLKPQFVEAGIRIITPYSHLTRGRNIIHKVYNLYKQKQIENNLKNSRIYIKEEYDLIIYFQVTKVRVSCLSTPKIITYVHGDIKTNENYRKNVCDASNVIGSSDLIICVSELVKKSFEEVMGISHNVEVVYNPIDSNRIYDMSCEKIEGFNNPYICAIGRLSPEKRFDLLIRIHKNILLKGIKHDLVIVGDGELKSELKKVVEETNTENSVHLVGFKKNPYPYINASLFTVCSSDTEGLSVVSMESLILGKPVVSSFPVVGELFGEEECGVLTDVSAESLEKGILLLLENKCLYNRCVEAVSNRKDYFESKKMIQRVEDLYDKILE